MRNSHPRYMCFPSVVEVGRETEVIIRPRDISRYFKADKEYELKVAGLHEDMYEGYFIPSEKELSFTVSGGCLHFTHTFDNEQEYSIRFCEKGGKLVKISLYAVESDLYNLRPLKGDFHTHTYYSDGQDGIAMTPADYREEGFDFFALTDHNRMYPSELAAELYNGIPLGMHIMRGEEVHTPGSALHIVHIGGKESVCNKYIHSREDFESAVSKIEEKLSHILQEYRRRTAMAKWSCDEIHNAGGLAIFPHPFWMPNAYNVSKDFCDILFDEKIFDAFEVMGGIGQKNNNLQLSLWQEQAFKGNVIPVVGSSDSHNHDFSKTVFARCFTIVFAKDNTTEDILEAVKSGYCVAGEIPMEDDNEVRFYSTKLRLVAFAHFLYENYFNETHRLCIGEGILMRRYAEGENVKAILSKFGDTVKNFYERFYGITAIDELDGKRQTYLKKCLRLQRKIGPATKGSSLQLAGGNGRRE